MVINPVFDEFDIDQPDVDELCRSLVNNLVWLLNQICPDIFNAGCKISCRPKLVILAGGVAHFDARSIDE